jgi:DNA-binding SARP family transcriptional activator
VRERIEKPLYEGPASTINVVVAPAGSGKTTLLSRVAAVATCPVGWYRVTANDSSEQALVAHLLQALHPIAGVIGGTDSMGVLLSTLDRWSGSGGLIIFDDVHEIAGMPSEHTLERFISLRPPRLRLVLGSRREPGINVPRLRVSGSVREVVADDLRFRSWEVEELFATVYREPLRPEAAAALTRRTGGWAAALQLFHLSTTGRGDWERHQAVAELAGRSRLIRSYLTRNVLADLPRRQRQFMMRTCTLGRRLSGPLCDALLGISGSARVLEELEHEQLFTSTDDGGQFFAYHEVLCSHLELALVEEYGAEEARSWYRRSGAVLESAREHRAAVRAYAKAEDWGAVSRLVRAQSGADLGVRVDDDGLLASVEWRQDPWLALARARRLVRNGALRFAASAFRDAATLFDDPEYQELIRRESGALTVWMRGMTQRDRYAAHWSTPLWEALQGIPADLHDRDPTAGSEYVRLCTGLVALVAGEFCLARKALETITDSPGAEEMASLAARIAVDLLDTLTGAHPEPAAWITDSATRADDAGLPWLARVARGLHVLVLISSGSASWRLDLDTEMLGECERIGDEWGAALTGLGVAVARRLSGDHDAGFRDAVRRFTDLGAPVLALWCRVLGHNSDRPPSESLARSALVDAERLGVRGAQALAMATLAASSAEERQLVAPARRLAERCGVPVAWLATPRSPVGSSVLHLGATVSIRCFGEYRMEVDGVSLDLTRLRPQARTLLRLMSLRVGRDHHREFLEDAIWPGTDHTVAGHRLQVAVSSIRGLFAGTGVTVTRSGPTYRLCLPTESVVDVVQFEAAIRNAAAASAQGDIVRRMRVRQVALALYTDDLPPDDTVTEHFGAERDRFRLAAAAAATALASDHWALGEHECAESAARRALDLDSCQELPWAILAELFESTGDLGSAEHARRERSRVRMILQLP